MENTIKFLTNTPFGFVMEIQNEEAYYSGYHYELLLNGESRGTYDKNVVPVFGLKPDTDYQVSLRIIGDDGENTGNAENAVNAESISAEIHTEKPGYLLDVHDFNALGDGESDDTLAINTAIYLAPKGSCVYIKKGTYIVSSILLKSDVDIYLEEGCLIKRTGDRTSMSTAPGYLKNYDYSRSTVLASWEGNPLDSYSSLIFGYEADNVRIYGDGIIDGNGEDGKWWDDRYEKNVGYRPRNLFINHCTDITIAGITSRNSAAWNFHPFYSENVHIYGVSLKSKEISPNTDGCNPESCKNVDIVGCHFSVGDDCIAIKSGKYFMSTYDYKPCENLYIANCYMGDGHGGITLGSEISCGVRNLTVEKCFMDGTDRGIRIKTRRGRGSGSILDNIVIKNLYMNNVLHGITFNMYYHCDPDGKSAYVQNKEYQPKDEYTPEIKNVFIENVKAYDIRGCAIFLYGLPESMIENVKITGNTFTFNKNRIQSPPAMLQGFEMVDNLGVFIRNAKKLELRDNTIVGEYVSMIEADEAEQE